MQWQMASTVLPVYDALECTCISRGAGCVEATKFNKPFWDNYWMKTVPNVMAELDKLKAATPAAMLTALPAAHMEKFSAEGTILSYTTNKELESRVDSLSQ